jgi:hypothetical protein
MTAVESKPDAARGVGSALADARTRSTSSAALSPQSRIGRLRDLDSTALRQEWRELCRSEPPRLSRDLLGRAVAHRLQELEFGGLPKWARQTLAGSAASTDPVEASAAPRPAPTPRLKPGARLVREWHGRTHSVIVLDDAFEFEGGRYRSLTQIAREITDANWSGPRFFGLIKRKVEAGLVAASAHNVDPGEPIGVGPPGQDGLSIEARRDITAVEAGEDAHG